jgi:hypothetical protein
MISHLPLDDPCLSCKYRTQACAYLLDGRDYDDACMSKRIELRNKRDEQK